MTRSIKHTFFYAHPPATIWEYLTKAELISQWLMENDFQPIIGYDFQFRTKPLPAYDFDGIVYCKVLEIVPFKKLSYSWKGGPGNGKINLDSVVVWTLIAKDEGTEVLLEHTGMMENVDIHSAMNIGWLKNMNKIDDLINIAHDTPNA